MITTVESKRTTDQPLILEPCVTAHSGARDAIKAAVDANGGADESWHDIEEQTFSSFWFSPTTLALDFSGKSFAISTSPIPRDEFSQWLLAEKARCAQQPPASIVRIRWGDHEEVWEPHRLLQSRIGKRFKNVYRSDTGVYLYWHEDPQCLGVVMARNVRTGMTQLYWFEST